MKRESRFWKIPRNTPNRLFFLIKGTMHVPAGAAMFRLVRHGAGVSNLT
jgi:hypothetical protein